MPRPAPVIKAVLPSSLPIRSSSLCFAKFRILAGACFLSPGRRVRPFRSGVVVVRICVAGFPAISYDRRRSGQYFMGEALMASVLDRPGSQEKFLTHGGKMLINNKRVDAKSWGTLDGFDPSPGAVIAKVAAGDKGAVDWAEKA